MNTSESNWETSWDAFVDRLATSLKEGVGTAELSARFGGRRITWTGIVEGKQLNELSPSISIGLSERLIAFGDRRVATLNGLSLPVRESAVSDWQSVEVGSNIRFTATFVDSSPFPPVEVKNLRSGRTIIMLRLSDGDLV